MRFANEARWNPSRHRAQETTMAETQPIHCDPAMLKPTNQLKPETTYAAAATCAVALTGTLNSLSAPSFVAETKT